MMANSVARSVLAGSRAARNDRSPAAAEAIEDECATCHMPMSRTEARMAGDEGRVFEHLVGPPTKRTAGIGWRMTASPARSAIRLPTRTSAAAIASRAATSSLPPGGRRTAPDVWPVQHRAGLSTIMRSATGFQPTEALHVRQSELCATCHTLVTKARGPNGEVVGELPEQMPFLEWKHSAFAAEQRSCQSCHMPAVEQDTPDRVGARRSAQGIRAPHLRRRQLLHAADAEPLSRRAGRDGAFAGARRGCRSDRREPCNRDSKAVRRGEDAYRTG